MAVFREFTFGRHTVFATLPEGHKCGRLRLHGHSYGVEVHVSGNVDRVTGMVMDFADIKAAFQPIHRRLDHHYLNEVEGLDNPTNENVARWIWDPP